MNIYELTEIAKYLVGLLDEDLIDEETVTDTLNSIGADDKVDSYCKIIKSYEADITAIESEIKRLKSLKEKAERNITRMKSALDGFMAATHQSETKTKFFAVYYRPATSVEVVDEKLIPQEYMKITTTKSPDKATIRKILIDGGTVAGCTLNEHKTIQIK